jgi:hypothetical protein
MVSKQMIAQVNMRYRTRMLSAGDVFTTSARDAKLLEAIGRAKPHVERVQVKVEPPPPKIVSPVYHSAIMQSVDNLRAKAQSLGIEVDARWREKRLQEEIDKVSNLRSFSSWNSQPSEAES